MAPRRGRIAITNITLTTPTVTNTMLGTVLTVIITIRLRQNTCIGKTAVTLIDGNYYCEDRIASDGYSYASTALFARVCVFEYAHNAVFCNAL